jgi:hypothetical protein
MTAIVVLNLIVSIIAIAGLVVLMRSAHAVAAERLPGAPPERASRADRRAQARGIAVSAI